MYNIGCVCVSAYLGVFVDALHKRPANVVPGLKETHVERRNRKKEVRRGEELERGEARGAASDNSDLHAVSLLSKPNLMNKTRLKKRN